MNGNQADALRQRIAEMSIGASTWRAPGCGGTAKAGRKELKTVDLTLFHVKSRKQFLNILDSETNRIMRGLPPGGRYWGVARKYLNIFLRSCVYNRPLATYYGIASTQQWLELPLDSHVVRGIKTCSGGGALPRWPGIMHLPSEDSLKYQNAARGIARRKGVASVDLEWCWWRQKPTKCLCANKR